MTTNAREIAYLALLSAEREEAFLSEVLDEWRKKRQQKPETLRLAQELAYGTCRMRLSLDYLMQAIQKKRPIRLKRKERLLMQLALYQYYYLDKIPLYAITNEMVALSKKYTHQIFTAFFNAFLHQLNTANCTLPHDDNKESLSIRYSQPLVFVEKLLKQYTLETVKEILSSLNKPPPIFATILKDSRHPNFTSIEQPYCLRLNDHGKLALIAADPHYYIQNITPATLMRSLHDAAKPPHRILDLCASPGGKLINAHTLFPKAALFAHDLNETKMKRLRENLEKYQINASLSSGCATKYPNSQQFDLIIIDAPCSNSGVFNKKPEARWRLNEETLKKHCTLQKKIIEHAKTLLTQKGEIYYMTCSIIDDENQNLVHSVSGLQVKREYSFLPNAKGWDGGYACSLVRS